MTSAVKIQALNKVYPGGVTALKSADLEIGDNEFFTLLGPSGCGKTTLLRLIAGFEEPTAGVLSLFGDDISTLPPEKRPVNTVFQHYSLFPHMSVFENVAFGLRRLGRSDKDAKARVEAMLDLVHLTDFAGRKPSQLSGGQQQRVALARALAPEPKVLLLDEPLSALDLKLRQSMRAELKRLQKDTGITFVFVTHDQEEALAMSDRIAVMSAGEIQQVGDPSAIYEHPENRFVAEFIGDANFFNATVAETTPIGTTYALDAGGTLTGPDEGRAKGEAVTLFFRPEKATLSQVGEGPNQLRCTVKDILYLGNSTDYWLALGDVTTLIVRSKNQTDGTVIADIGEQINLSLDPAALRILAT